MPSISVDVVLGTTTLIPAVTGASIRIIGGMLSVPVATGVKFQSNVTDLCGVIQLILGEAMVLPPMNSSEWFKTAKGEPFKIVVSGVGSAVTGWLVYETTGS